ncbi:MAG: insulinase family protein [Myxococcota bacterium]|nr:insulinase family protein [Myxococcota bacterium]
MIETTHIHGWKVYHYQKKDAPDIVSIRLLFPNYNNDRQIGLSHLYNRLLLTQIQEASDRFIIGGDIAIGTDYTHRLISIDTLQEDFSDFFALIRTSIATFEVSDEELEQEKLLIKQEKHQERSQSKILLDALGQEKFFGCHHPFRYDVEGSVHSIDGFSPQDLKAPNLVQHGIIITVSAQGIAEVSSQLDSLLPKQAASNGVVLPPPQTEWGSYLMPYEQQEQAHLLYLRRTLPNTHPLYDAMQLGLMSLTSMFNSRLNQKLRKHEGLTYGVQSYHRSMSDFGYLSISLSVDKNRVAEARAYTQEILGSCTENWTFSELDIAKKIMLRTSLQCQTTCARIADHIEARILRNQEPWYREDWTTQIRNIALSEVKEAMRLFSSSPVLDLCTGASEGFSSSFRTTFPQKYQ